MVTWTQADCHVRVRRAQVTAVVQWCRITVGETGARGDSGWVMLHEGSAQRIVVVRGIKDS